jgi:hypothetical protein
MHNELIGTVPSGRNLVGPGRPNGATKASVLILVSIPSSLNLVTTLISFH